jgi:hypothetical protein
MMHAQRRWGLSEVESAAALAKMLSGQTWTLCSAFFVSGHPEYLFLNDATHEDGAGEYGVAKRLADGKFRASGVNSFSWCNELKAREYIESALTGQFDGSDFAQPVTPKIDLPGQHGRCHLCA